LSPKRVLIVEDHFLISEYLSVWINAYGHSVCGIATSAKDAIVQARQHKPDLILMDMQLNGDATGVDAALAILAECQVRIVYVSADADAAKLKRLGDGPHEILSKPVDVEVLRALLES
jgi:two-component system, response regulator PdtaR